MDGGSTTGVDSDFGLGLAGGVPPIRRTFCLVGVGEGESADDESEVVIIERCAGGLDRVKVDDTGGFEDGCGGCFGSAPVRCDEDRIEEEVVERSVVNSSLGDARESLLEVR